jgi:hypothetical protein
MSEHQRVGLPLDAAGVLDLFQALSDRLEARGVKATLFAVGGAAMALAYDPDRTTRDVDAVFTPAPAVREAAEEVAAARGLEPDWLNDAAKGFMPGGDDSPVTVFESEWLTVLAPSPEYLLAMKLFASRGERDLEDAAVLFNKAGYTSTQEGVELLMRSYPEGQLAPRHRYRLEEVAQLAAERRAGLGAPDAKPSRPRPDLRQARGSPGGHLSPPQAFGAPIQRPRPPSLGL